MSRIDDELEQAVRDGEADPDKGAAKSGAAGSGSASPNPALRRGSAAAVARSTEVAQPVVADAEEHKRSWGLLVGLLVLGGGVLAFVFNSGEDSVVYSYGVDQVKAQAGELKDRSLRVQGMLVSGTLTRRDEPCEYNFMMQKSGVQGAEPLKVQYAQCVVPDTFRDVKGVEVEVTAEGRLAEDGHLEATKIFAKCPSKYEMREGAAAMGGKGPDHGPERGPAKPEYIPAKVEGIR
jgi:cytochrome c-type biogenesis protein CcmE